VPFKGEMKRRKCGDFFLRQRWSDAAMGHREAVWWRLLCFNVGRKKEADGVEWASWLLGQLGQKMKKILSE
jgi:hypothetical protein